MIAFASILALSIGHTHNTFDAVHFYTPPAHSRISRPAYQRMHQTAASHDTRHPFSLEADQTPRSMYIHFPFCKQRCHYCDFPVRPLGKNHRDARARRKIDAYVDALLLEIQHGGAGAFGVAAAPAAVPLDTVYIGGGTPSLLPPEHLRCILDALRRRHGLAPGAEVSCVTHTQAKSASCLVLRLACSL
jgi:coproporphyrinogen III oxidase-like Fe-S oxidoreductase